LDHHDQLIAVEGMLAVLDLTKCDWGQA
jgi:hypothetical protein